MSVIPLQLIVVDDRHVEELGVQDRPREALIQSQEDSDGSYCCGLGSGYSGLQL